MAFFTDTTNAPKIYTQGFSYWEKVQFSTDTGLIGKKRTGL